MNTTPPTPETPTAPRPYYSQPLADARCRAVANIVFCAVKVDSLLCTNTFAQEEEIDDMKEQIAIGMRSLLGNRVGEVENALDDEMECTLIAAGEAATWLGNALEDDHLDVYTKSLVEDACKAFADYLELRDKDDENPADASMEDVTVTVVEWKAPTQLLNPPVMLPLPAVLALLDRLRFKSKDKSRDISELYLSGWQMALDTVTDNLEDLYTSETPPTYDFDVAPQPGPPADGSEEICTEFTLHWKGLEATDHPLWEGLRLRLLTWATRNQTDCICSNIVDDYLWGEILDTLGTEYSIFDSGHNYLDIALRPDATHESPMIRVVQNYRFDPGYAKHHSRVLQRV